MDLLQKKCRKTNKIHSEIWCSHSGDYEGYCVLGYDVARTDTDWELGHDFGISVHKHLKDQSAGDNYGLFKKRYLSKKHLVHRDHTSPNCMVANALQGLAPLYDKMQSGMHCAVTGGLLEMLCCLQQNNEQSSMRTTSNSKLLKHCNFISAFMSFPVFI